MSLRNVLRRVRKSANRLKAHLFIFAVKVIVKHPRCQIALSNDTKSKIDGTGAQIQRMISIIALSRLIKVPFHQNLFVDVSVHPLDPFQDVESKNAFIGQMNQLFAFGNSSSQQASTVIPHPKLTGWKLFRTAIHSFLLKDALVLNVVEPYPITDEFHDISTDLVNYFPNWLQFSESFKQNSNQPTVSVHYRQGVGGLAIYPGQNIPRELSPQYFLLKLIDVSGNKISDLSIQLFTDAPLEDMSYEPPREQFSHWEGSPGFTDGIMTIKGNNLLAFFNQNGVEVKVHTGGNPLEAIAIMSISDILITSRSSLSYVAGLLNSHGKIVAADGFWHPAPSNWYSN